VGGVTVTVQLPAQDVWTELTPRWEGKLVYEQKRIFPEAVDKATGRTVRKVMTLRRWYLKLRTKPTPTGYRSKHKVRYFTHAGQWKWGVVDERSGKEAVEELLGMCLGKETCTAVMRHMETLVEMM
jgi:hypothetical protein